MRQEKVNRPSRIGVAAVSTVSSGVFLLIFVLVWVR